MRKEKGVYLRLMTAKKIFFFAIPVLVIVEDDEQKRDFNGLENIFRCRAHTDCSIHIEGEQT